MFRHLFDVWLQRLFGSPSLLIKSAFDFYLCLVLNWDYLRCFPILCSVVELTSEKMLRSSHRVGHVIFLASRHVLSEVKLQSQFVPLSRVKVSFVCINQVTVVK